MSYEKMAYYYDQLMEDAPYEDWVTLIEEVIQSNGTHVESIADLGCGTGQITTKLAKSGYRMIGIDNSESMLSIADNHANNRHVSVQWLHQDLRRLDGIEKQDMVISFCDVINYITEEEDVQTVFSNAASILKTGGLFVFDVHALPYVQNYLVNQTFAVVRDDISYVWFCLEGDAEGEMYHDLTFFVQEGSQYSRFDEWHHQKTYPIEFYEHVLKKSGFNVLSISSDFSLQSNYDEQNSERIFITAVKQAE